MSEATTQANLSEKVRNADFCRLNKDWADNRGFRPTSHSAFKMCKF